MKKNNDTDEFLLATIILILLSLLFYGCTTSKKIQSEVKESQKVNEHTIEHAVSETNKSIDTTKVSSVKTNQFQIDFFNPNEVDDYETIIQLMRDRNEPYSSIGIIKSIKGSVTKVNETKAGVSEENSKEETDAEKKNNIDTKKEEKIVTKSEPFFQKFKLYLIVAGVIVLSIAIFFITKKGLFKKIMTIIYKFIKK